MTNYILIALDVLCLIIVFRVDNDSFKYCETQTKVSRDYCLKAYGF